MLKAAAQLVDRELSELTDLLERIESIGDEILLDKKELVHLDEKRQSNRECIRSLTKLDGNSSIKKVYLNFAKTFVRLPVEKSKKLIEHDQKIIAEEIDRVNNGLKEKLDTLYRLENRQDDLASTAAFKLRPVNEKL
uniref:P53 and DNA damage-regulated protein 1 n=1 Tax=Romanomermis culicivorax TaxID=13658 RepID=A0A915L5J3_ROMCU